MATTDQAHLDLWKSERDPKAFQQLVDDYSGMVFGTGRRITGSAEDAEDVSQECFLKLAKRPPSIQYSLGSWLHRVATNHALNLIKKDQRRGAREYVYDESSETPHDSRHEAEWDEIQEDIDKAIDELPLKYKDAIVEHFLKCQTHNEVAQRLGVSRSTITYRIDKGIDHIRATLRRNGFTVGATTLASMLQAITVEAVPASLSTSLSKLALSGVGVGGFSLLSWLSSLFGGFSIWGKMMAGATALMALLTTLGWGTGFFDPIELNDEFSSFTVPEVSDAMVQEEQIEDTAATPPPDTPEDENMTARSDSNETLAAEDTADEEKEDEEEPPHIQGIVVTAFSRIPIPNVRVVIYPKESVHYELVSDKDLPNLSEIERTQLKSVQKQLTMTPEEDVEIPWYVYAKTMRLAPDPSAAFNFQSDENGEFDASILGSGDYTVFIESDRHVNKGVTKKRLEHAGEASIGGASDLTIFESDEPLEFAIEAVTKSATSGRVFDKYAGDGYSDLTVAAYRWTDSAYLRILEGRTKTDDEGNFSFVGLQPGEYEFEREDVVGLHGETATKAELDGLTVSGIEFPITTGAALEGTVYWGDEPLVDAEFLFQYAHVPDDVNKAEEMGGKLIKTPVITDANGQYFVSGIKDISGTVYATVKLNNGDIRMSRWERNIYIEDGDFQTVDLKFDVGPSSIEGKLTRGGKPLKRATVIWYPYKMTSGEQRSRTDANGYYQFENIDAGQSRIEFYVPGAFEGVNRSFHIAEGETLELDIDLPAQPITFTAINVPKSSKAVWVWIRGEHFQDANGSNYFEHIKVSRHETVSMARLFKRGRNPHQARVWGLEPGTYRIGAVSHDVQGWVGLYQDDNEKLKAFLEGTYESINMITVDASTKNFQVDFEGARNRLYRYNLEDE